MRFAAVMLLALATLLSAPAAEPFVSKDGRYSVQFPGKPKEDTHATDTASGKVKLHNAIFAQPDGAVFAVIYSDLPAAALKGVTAESLLAGARDGITGKEGRLLSDRDAPFGPEKVPSREVLIDKGQTTIRARLVFRDGRLYQVMVLGSKAAVTGPAADDFLASFALAK